MGDTRFDILVNNAGLSLATSIEGTTIQVFDEIMAINVEAPFFVTQSALSRIRKKVVLSIFRLLNENISSGHSRI